MTRIVPGTFVRRAPTIEPVVVRVATWNLGHRFGDYERRLAAIVATLRAERPDVVCLQEAWAAEGAAASGGSLRVTDDMDDAFAGAQAGGISPYNPLLRGAAVGIQEAHK